MVFDLPARFARLADLEQRAAQPEAIADTDVAFGDALCDNVLAEGCGSLKHVVPAEPGVPTCVMITRIMVHRHIRATVMDGVRNHVAFDTEATDGRGTGKGAFVDCAHFGAVEGPGQSGAQRADLGFHAASLRRVSAYQSRWTPSAPFPR